MAMVSNDAFGAVNVKIDPSRVVASIKENIHAQNYKEATVVQGDAANEFTPMQWPLFDDGKPVSTNAMGYEIGGYYRRHQEAMRLAKVKAEREAEEERLAAEQEAIALAQQAQAEAEQAQAPVITPEELEAIRNAARNEGYQEGLSQGHAEGYEKGFEQGKQDGIVQGATEGKQQGYDEGFRIGRDEGYTAGQEAGIAAGSDIVTTQADRFRHLADMLANPLREMDEQVTDETVYIISRLARVLLKREIKGDVEFLKNSIEKCFAMLPEAKKGAEIELSENDYALMVAAIGSDYMKSQGWNLKPSETMEDGDVLVNTKVSSAQWRVDDRIDALISDFLTGSADAVASARKEVIEGAPDYDAVPKKQIIPPRDLLGMSERIEQNMMQMAPKPNFTNEEERNLAQAMGLDVGDGDIDPDAAELARATMIDQHDAELNAQAQQMGMGEGDMGMAQEPMSAPRGAGLEDEDIEEVQTEIVQPGQVTGGMQGGMAAAAQALRGNPGQMAAGTGAAAAVRAAQAQ